MEPPGDAPFQGSRSGSKRNRRVGKVGDFEYRSDVLLPLTSNVGYDVVNFICRADKYPSVNL